MVIFECGIVIILQHKIEEHTEIRSVSKHSLTPCMCTFENVNCVECSGGSAIQFRRNNLNCWRSHIYKYR